MPRNFSGVRRLKTDLQGGGTCNWLPESELTTKELRVTQGGSYLPSQEGAFAFTKITVDVPNEPGKGITGHDPDTGEDMTITVDPETGELEETIMPSSIDVTIEPTKMTYEDGDTIDYTGIQVKAFDAQGDVWQSADYPDGIIPFEELILSATIAEATPVEGDEWDVSGTDLKQPVYLKEVHEGDWILGEPDQIESRYITKIVGTSPVYMCDLATNIQGWVLSIFLSLESYSVASQRKAPSSWDPHWAQDNGERVEIAGIGSAYVSSVPTQSFQTRNVETSAKQDVDYMEFAVLALHGGGRKSGDMPVPVQWKRPNDRKTLETSFNIHFSSGGGGE